MHFLARQEPLQVIRHFFCRRIAVLWLLFQRFQANVLQLSGHFGIPPPRQDRQFLADLSYLFAKRFRMKRRASRQNFVQNCSQRKDIATRVELRAWHRMLRRKIIRRSHYLARARHPCAIALQVLGQAEIENLRLQVDAHQNVGRFQVAVQNLVRV